MDFQDLIKYGVYYNPASKHYGFKGSVNCDRCHKSNIQSSIGYNNLDLCMSCVCSVEKQKVQDEVKSKSQYKVIDTDMDMDRAQFMTNMHQLQYKPQHPKMYTYMHQTQYR